jgi:hypothetical protein
MRLGNEWQRGIPLGIAQTQFDRPKPLHCPNAQTGHLMQTLGDRLFKLRTPTHEAKGCTYCPRCYAGWQARKLTCRECGGSGILLL